MDLDRALLAQHASHRSEGIEERTFFLDVPGGRCFAIEYRPRDPRGPGFVVCHSYALELLTLRRSERTVARALASLGHPVLFLQRRGFGDSSGSIVDATLEEQLSDTRAAVDHVRSFGVPGVGLVGTRFGALVAGALAREGGVDRLLLVNPALSGGVYFKSLIKEMHLVRMSDPRNEERRSMDDLLVELRSEGVLDVLGHPIHRRLYEELEPVDLAADVGAFTGRAMLVQVSKRPSIRRVYEAFADTVRRAGGECRIEFVKEPPGATFGSAAFVSTGDPMARVDVQVPILERLGELVATWMTA